MPEDTSLAAAVISSVIVHARDSELDRICAEITQMPGTEIGSRAIGKLVVVLEASSDGQLTDAISDISTIPGVLGVNLVFHHTEPAPEAGEKAGELP